MSKAVELITINNSAEAARKTSENNNSCNKKKDKHFIKTLEQKLTGVTPGILQVKKQVSESKKNEQENGGNSIITPLLVLDTKDLRTISRVIVEEKTIGVQGQKIKDSFACIKIPERGLVLGLRATNMTANSVGAKQHNMGVDSPKSEEKAAYSGFSDGDSPEAAAKNPKYFSVKKMATCNKKIAAGKINHGRFGTKEKTANIIAKETGAIRESRTGRIDRRGGEGKDIPRYIATEKEGLVKAENLEIGAKQSGETKENNTSNIKKREKGNSSRNTVKKATDFTGDKIANSKAEVQDNNEDRINGSSTSKPVLRGFNEKETEPFHRVQQKHYEQAAGKPAFTGFNFVEKPASIPKKTILPRSQVGHMTRQMITKIKAGISGNKQSSLEISLKPEYLGKVKIQLHSTDGMVSIRVIADNGETANLLNSNLQYIRDNIEQQGIKLQHLGVGLENHQEQGSYSGNDGRESNQKNAFLASNLDDQYEIIEKKEPYSLLSHSLNLLA